MEYQKLGIKPSDVVVRALEAIGYEKECRNIARQYDYFRTILRDSFFKNELQNPDFVGSFSEGVESCFFPTEYVINKTDTDEVYHLDVKLKISLGSSRCIIKRLSVPEDFTIIPYPNFPGYVYLQLHEPIMGHLRLPNTIFEEIKLKELSPSAFLRKVKVELNGPARSQYLQDGVYFRKTELVFCLIGKNWPEEARQWQSRNKPNNWPSKMLIEKINSKGFNLAPVAHKDCVDQKFQWRIGIRGEKELVLNLNETQILCLVALRLILKCDIQLIHHDVLSAYHMKNLIFWCAELESCHWAKENFEICLKTCISRLINYVMSRRFPHYFIEDRNLINSRMTLELTEQIVKALIRYRDDISSILSLSVFDKLKIFTHNFQVELMEMPKQQLIFFQLFGVCHALFINCMEFPSSLWKTYQGHDTAINLQNAQDILSFLKNTKRHVIRHYIAYAKNMVGLLYYSRSNDKKCQNDKLKARKLLRSSLTFENVSLKFRVATFYLMENELEDCLGFCDAFLSNRNKFKSMNEKRRHSMMVYKTIEDFVTASYTVTEITRLKEGMLTIFYQQCISERCRDEKLHQAETVLSRILTCKQHKIDFEMSCEEILLVFNNYANLVFRYIISNVPYLASEKWAVPEVIRYELLSVKRCHPKSQVYGIYIDPMLNCLMLKYLCYQKTFNLTQRDEMLTKMANYTDGYLDSGKLIDAELHNSLPLYRVHNIVAYCCVKAGRYQMALNYILKSLKLYRSKKNTAYAYLRCVCGILNSLYGNQ